MSQWMPAAAMDNLQARARLLGRIRRFFEQRGVLEVDTPALSRATVTDLHLHPFVTEFAGPGAGQPLPLYLQTSPEFHMKRLLAAGSGAIYQLCKAFRNEEAGRWHNPEFTMLEWYRPGFDDDALMEEVAELLVTVLECPPPERLSYRQAFVNHLRLDPLETPLAELQRHAAEAANGDWPLSETDRDTLLQLLFSLAVEPNIGQQVPVMVYHFPASQAALARIDASDPRVARRFEVYFRGIELANGFFELTDADEQLARFEQDNRRRAELGLVQQPIDHELIAALAAGLPDCAGVALGVDRLLMLALGAGRIDEVIAFPCARA